MRSYSFHPGGRQKYVALLQKEGIHILRRHLGEPVAFYATKIGDLNKLIHLWQYDSLEDREERRMAMQADPDWQAYRPKIIPLIATQESTILDQVVLPDP